MPTRSVFSSESVKDSSDRQSELTAKELGQSKSKKRKNKSKNLNQEAEIPFLETILNEQQEKKLENKSKIGHTDTSFAKSEPKTVKNEQNIKNNVQNGVKKQESLYQRPVRPKTAKPSGLKRRSASSNSSEKSSSDIFEKSNKEKQKIRSSSTSTYSLSSISTFEGTFDENDSENTFDRDVTENLITYRESQIREELLHRYLDLHISESYEKQKLDFDRYSRQPPARPKKSSSKKANLTRDREFGEDPPKLRHARLAYRKPKFNIVGSREAEVKRSIRRLIRKLKRLEAYKLFLSHRIPSKADKVNAMTGKPPRPKTAKPGRQRKEKLQEKSDATGQNQKIDEVKVVIPSPEVQTEPKGILKSPDTSVDPIKEKHVRMNNRRKSNDSYSSTERGQEIKSSSHYYYQGQVFSYNYLASLLGTLQCSKSEVNSLLGPQGPLKRVSLLRAPVRPKFNNYKRRPVSRSNKHSARDTDKESNESKTEQRQLKNREDVHRMPRPKTAIPKAYIVIKDEGNGQANTVPPSPRVTPGTEPIKCNWKPEKQQPKENKDTDHQLKNTDNPAIAEWLRRKNNLARQEKHMASRRNRVKRDRLMEEYNEKEEHREQALVEYEKWKKRKNKEILLRRRKETLDANCEKNFNSSRPNTAAADSTLPRNSRQTDHMLTTFSDLRSSAVITPLPPAQHSKLKDGSKPRPKSAPTKVSFNTPVATHAMKKENFVPVKFDFENGDVTVLGNAHANLSAREPIMGNKSSERATNGFLREFLEVTSEKTPSMFDIPPPGTFAQTQDVITEKQDNNKSPERNQYNDWVRTDGKTPIKPKNKRRSKTKPKESRMVHDPLTNELISDLAKRRIQKILDQKKRVDSGLKPRPASASPAKAEKEPNKKWRMSEDFAEEKGETKKKEGLKQDDRPKFSYDKKTSSKSTLHQRNPVIRQALSKA